MSFNVNNIIRKNIQNLEPYSSTRDGMDLDNYTLLDINENAFSNPYGKGLNRYPNARQTSLKSKIAGVKKVKPENIYLGNGSDECIDILIRCFCEPKEDEIIICPPTFGMYKVYANINNVKVKEVLLKKNSFELDIDSIKKQTTKRTKLIFICTPNNPTGSVVEWKKIEELTQFFNGLLVIDEAYIDFFETNKSVIKKIRNNKNIVVLQTFSKAFAMAAARLGMVVANQEVINFLNKVKAPYNINDFTQKAIYKALDNIAKIEDSVRIIKNERANMAKKLKEYSFVKKVYPSKANSLLVEVSNSDELFNYMLTNKVIISNRSKMPLLKNCVRFTVGNPKENKKVLTLLNQFENL